MSGVRGVPGVFSKCDVLDVRPNGVAGTDRVLVERLWGEPRREDGP